MIAPELNPETVCITHHAITRYRDRRETREGDSTIPGLVRLLTSAARQPVPPLRVDSYGRSSRRYVAGGYVLVMSGDNSTLCTMYRAGKKANR